jgi:hypothetical protein
LEPQSPKSTGASAASRGALLPPGLKVLVSGELPSRKGASRDAAIGPQDKQKLPK